MDASQPQRTNLARRARARRFLLAALWACVPFAACPVAVAAEAPDPDRVIDGFLEACASADWLSGAEREKVVETVAALRKDTLASDAVIAEALRVTCPDFAAALDALSEGDTADAQAKLRALQPDNPYLAAERAFYLAWAHVRRDDFEAARPLLDDVIGKHARRSLHVGEALFLRGLCQSRALERVEAIESFTEYLDRFPDAPTAMRATALENRLALEALVPGSLDDVHDHMDFSHRRLVRANTGERTQEVQDHVVDMLTAMIDEMEKCGGKCPGCGCCQGGPGKGGKKSGSGQGGNTPGLSSGTSTAARRTIQAGPRAAWADLRNKAREAETLTAMKSRFPARYRELVEQYYRSLQEEPEE